MTERQKSDLALLARTLFRSRPIGSGLLWFFLSGVCVLTGGGLAQNTSLVWLLLPVMVGVTAWLISADHLKDQYRFDFAPYGHLWKTVTDRFVRFERAYGRSPRVVKETLSDTPDSIRRLMDSIYMALRRADQVRTLVAESEPHVGMFLPSLDVPQAMDEQAQVLYGVAQRNKEDYRRHYQKLMGGVERTEAQVAVLVSSLDSLRLKMLDYRVTGGKVEMHSSDLLSRLESYRTEFHALEKAVDEIESDMVVQLGISSAGGD